MKLVSVPACDLDSTVKICAEIAQRVFAKRFDPVTQQKRLFEAKENTGFILTRRIHTLQVFKDENDQVVGYVWWEVESNGHENLVLRCKEIAVAEQTSWQETEVEILRLSMTEILEKLQDLNQIKDKDALHFKRLIFRSWIPAWRLTTDKPEEKSAFLLAGFVDMLDNRIVAVPDIKNVSGGEIQFGVEKIINLVKVSAPTEQPID